MKHRILILIAAISFLLPSHAGANVSEENFKIDTTADLVALCGVSAEDPNAVAAIHMCHG